jgi:hypothetical protein
MTVPDRTDFVWAKNESKRIGINEKVRQGAAAACRSIDGREQQP